MTLWEKVPGYEGLYSVSDEGHIWSHISGRVLRGHINKDGYCRVKLVKDGKHRLVMLHRLVLEAFYGPRPAGSVTRHLNGNPADNRLSNLVWGTESENHSDMVTHSRAWYQHKTRYEATHCPQGHEYNEENTYWHNTNRYCRTCNRIRARQRYRARRDSGG